jgi:hypothetical protein
MKIIDGIPVFGTNVDEGAEEVQGALAVMIVNRKLELTADRKLRLL